MQICLGFIGFMESTELKVSILIKGSVAQKWEICHFFTYPNVFQIFLVFQF